MDFNPNWEEMYRCVCVSLPPPPACLRLPLAGATTVSISAISDQQVGLLGRLGAAMGRMEREDEEDERERNGKGT